jgi:regulator of CtrA degradation
MFQQVFREGMALVEETANYLDGTGREQSRRLPKTAALAYATESMRLTTRLMQIASWLLIQRAVAEGEMPASEAMGESGRVPLKPPVARRQRPFVDDLPDALRDLMARTDQIYARLYRIDRMLGPVPADAPAPGPNAVVDQIGRLKAAFDKSRRDES